MHAIHTSLLGNSWTTWRERNRWTTRGKRGARKNGTYVHPTCMHVYLFLYMCVLIDTEHRVQLVHLETSAHVVWLAGQESLYVPYMLIGTTV